MNIRHAIIVVVGVLAVTILYTACFRITNRLRKYYRLGPEHRYPTAFDDCLAATRWISSHAASLGVDATRLAVGGDSAGGNLAASVSLAARDGIDGPSVPIAFQLLIYPGIDMNAGHPSHRTNGEGYLLTKDTIAYFYSHYFDDRAQYNEWRASPILHANHAGLPRALIVTAGRRVSPSRQRSSTNVLTGLAFGASHASEPLTKRTPMPPKY